MNSQIRPVLTIFILLTFITGVLYPFLVTSIAQIAFPFQANGSIIDHNGDLLGSQLIGQNFTSSMYFWGRPSSTSGSQYTSFDSSTLTGSSGSNMGPLSQTLMETIQTRVDYLHNADQANSLPIPIDLVTASASGLDPNISVLGAYYQISRVAQARGLSEEEIISLINQFTENRQLGFLGESRVNVLLLNLALDGIQ